MNIFLRNAGKRIIETGKSDRSSSLIQNTVSTKFVANVPKTTASDIDKIIADEPHVIYGSLANISHGYGFRQPKDVDLSVEVPQATAIKISNELRQKGYQSKIVQSRSPNSYSVKILKNNAWETIVDVHPLQKHYKTYPTTYASTDKPERIGRFNIQSVKDQFFRKGNLVLKKGGAEPHRVLKDEVDFINISRLMLDQKQLQAESEIKRVQNARKDLNRIKQHTKQHRGWNSKDYPLNKDPIPQRLEQKFVNYAVQNPEKDVRTITLKNNKVVSIPIKKKKLHNNIFDPNNSAYKFWMG